MLCCCNGELYGISECISIIRTKPCCYGLLQKLNLWTILSIEWFFMYHGNYLTGWFLLIQWHFRLTNEVNGILHNNVRIWPENSLTRPIFIDGLPQCAILWARDSFSSFFRMKYTAYCSIWTWFIVQYAHVDTFYTETNTTIYPAWVLWNHQPIQSLNIECICLLDHGRFFFSRQFAGILCKKNQKVFFLIGKYFWPKHIFSAKG